MANWAYTNYVIEGPKETLKKIHEAILHHDIEEASNIYVKVNGTWQKVVNVYKKVSGSWVLQSDKSSLFSQDVSYINGDNL